MGKKTGRKAQLSGDFEYPVPPINVVATDVGTDRPYNNGAIRVHCNRPTFSYNSSTVTKNSNSNIYNYWTRT